MVKPFLIIAAFCASSLPVWAAHAQFAQESHTVTVEVEPSAGVVVTQRTLELTISAEGFHPGQSIMTVEDQRTMIAWRINRKNMKITVQTDNAAPRYTLKVQPVRATAGAPVPEQVLSTTPRDFIRNVGRTAGLAWIRYRGEAAFEQGSGSDHHLVTFTVTQQ